MLEKVEKVMIYERFLMQGDEIAMVESSLKVMTDWSCKKQTL
jgi:hypothetical protein